MAAQRPSPLGLARGALTVAVALGLARVLDGGRWAAAAFAAAAAPHVLAAIAARRSWRATTTLAAQAAGAFVTTVVVVEAHTFAGLRPTRETFRAFAHDVADAPDILRSAIVPVPPLGGALLLALGALWCAGAISEWSARRLDTPLGATGPSLVLFVAMAALGDGSWVAVTVAYALALAGYLLALHHAETAERRSWFHTGDGRRSRVLAGGSVTAGVVVATAALLGPLLPGARSDAWLDYRSIGDSDDGGGLLKATTPIVGIQAKLRDDPDRVVFTVSSSEPSYWRVIGLDVYDGALWTLDDEGASADDIPAPPEQPTSVVVEQRFQIRDGDPHWLPAAYRPEEISLDDAKIVRESLTLYVNRTGPLADVSYTVRSRIAKPTEAELMAARSVDPAAFRRYTELPNGLAAPIRDLAREVTAGAAGPYEQAIAIQDHLTGGEYAYDIDVARAEDVDTLEDFLFVVKRGYCEQFATAFAAMARSVGLPTRIAVGYTTGEALGGNVYRVRNANAHAWPEVYLEGVGWTPFEPTPGRFEPTLGNGDPSAVEGPGGTSSTTSSTVGTGATTPATQRPNPALDDQITLGGAPAPAGETTSTARRVVTAAVAVLASALAVALVAVAALYFVAARRAWRRRHAPDPRDRVLGAWAQAIDLLAEAGVEARPSATPTEFALRHAPAQGAGDAGAPLVHLARLQTAALFAPAAPSDADGDEAWEHTDAIDRALWSRVPIVTRLARRLDPRRTRETSDV